MKREIKEKAISLFNSNGISVVSMKQIADSLNLSVDNLSCHYNTKAKLVSYIYEDMYAESLHFSVPEKSQITLSHFEKIMVAYSLLQDKYAFFYKEIAYIWNNYPDVAKLNAKANIQRFKEGKSLINYYIETDQLLPEGKFTDYNKLIYSFWMISTFWTTQKLVMKDCNYTISESHFVDVIWNLLIPHMTEKGIEEYRQLKRSIKIPETNIFIPSEKKQPFSRIWKKTSNKA